MKRLPESAAGISWAYKLQSSSPEVRATLAEVTEVLTGQGVPPDARGGIELVLAEALNNVVEHAYPAAAPGPIRLGLRLDPDHARLQLRDCGRPMPALTLPEGRLRHLGRDGDLPEGGFGWYLIRKLASDVRYMRRGDENILDITMTLQSRPAGG